MLFLSIYSLHFILRRYSSSSVISSPPKFMLTSLSSQTSRLGDSLVLGNAGIGLIRNKLHVEIT